MASMKKIILYLEWGSILGLLACGLWVFLKLPLESSQGFPQKIMYLHVPTFFSTYLAFFVVFTFSIAYLWKRELVFDQIAKASAVRPSAFWLPLVVGKEGFLFLSPPG